MLSEKQVELMKQLQRVDGLSRKADNLQNDYYLIMDKLHTAKEDLDYMTGDMDCFTKSDYLEKCKGFNHESSLEESLKNMEIKPANLDQACDDCNEGLDWNYSLDLTIPDEDAQTEAYYETLQSEGE